MTEDRNVAVVQRAYEAFGRGDINGLLALLDENIPWETPGPADLPTAGRRRGHQAVAEFFQTIGTVSDIVRFEPKTFVSQGDRVVVLGEETGRMKATGNSVEFEWVHVFTIRDGKVVAFKEYGDVSAIVAELRSAKAAV
jgi:ketosteroid isomerase-like protein